MDGGQLQVLQPVIGQLEAILLVEELAGRVVVEPHAFVSRSQAGHEQREDAKSCSRKRGSAANRARRTAKGANVRREYSVHRRERNLASRRPQSRGFPGLAEPP